MGKHILYLYFGIVFLTGLAGCSSPVFLSRSQRYELEADRLAAMDRTSEAMLAYHQAAVADPENHSARRKLIPLYQQQGRLREADDLFRELPESERIGLNFIESQGEPQETTELKLQWINREIHDIPAGFIADDASIAVLYQSGQAALLRSSTGQTIWVKSIPENITSPPALTSDFVILGCGSGRVIALDRATGEERWSAYLPGSVFARPLADRDRIYTASYGGKVTAFDRASGKPLWQVNTGSAVPGTPLLSENRLYAGTTGGQIFSIDATNGNALWEKPARLTGSLEASIILAPDFLLAAGTDSRLTALDLNGRAYYWQYSTSDSIYANPLVARDLVFVFSIGQKAAALAINTGLPLWEVDLPVPVRSTPVFLEGNIYFAGVSGPYIFVMDSTGGNIHTRIDTGDWIEAGPQLVENILLLAGKDGAMIAYRLN
ncbi:MAG: PQQ-binding-like beta-propeller repeat protein [Leptolinea sp.]|jgi:outer membrane protein assembly factor BamB|nr:PQQ-binding-like beta-propeller repeat protein [Leptolinea sp.]